MRCAPTLTAGLSLGKIIPVLAEQHRVFAPDWPDFGNSDAMPITWRIEECVEFLADLLGALGLKRASLIGVSMVEDLLLGSQFELPKGSSGSYSSTARAWALRSLKSSILFHDAPAVRG